MYYVAIFIHQLCEIQGEGTEAEASVPTNNMPHNFFRRNEFNKNALKE